MRIKLDENLPARLAGILSAQKHDVHTVPGENLSGRPDTDIWQVACKEGRLLITQDMDFSDVRRFAPGTHAGLLLLRLREPGAQALIAAVTSVVDDMPEWQSCFVVVTENKVRVKRP
jgi:predicted nuclease of predicted toxin-antitoxin system